MTNLDLQNLCEKIGVFASGSRMQIKEKLLREFKSVSRGTISMTNESPSIKLDPSNVLHKKTLKINGNIFGNLNKRSYISFVIIDNIKT